MAQMKINNGRETAFQSVPRALDCRELPGRVEALYSSSGQKLKKRGRSVGAQKHPYLRTHAHTQTHARTLQPPAQLHHARTCIAAPHAACHAQAVCRSTQKMRLSQARFECLPIFPPCLSQRGRKSKKHCNSVPPHMNSQCLRSWEAWAGIFRMRDRKRKRG